MAQQGEPRRNGYPERLMRTSKREEVTLTEYRDSADVYAQIGRFLDVVYQLKRIHLALGYQTSEEFEAAYQAGLLTSSRCLLTWGCEVSRFRAQFTGDCDVAHSFHCDAPAMTLP